jgi:hypothetical protein
MSSRKSRKDSLEWQLPFPKPFKMTNTQFEEIVENLPKSISLTTSELRNLQLRIEKARGNAHQLAERRLPQPSALHERLIKISQKTHDLINALSSPSPGGDGSILLRGEPFSINNKRSVTDSVMNELADAPPSLTLAA